MNPDASVPGAAGALRGPLSRPRYHRVALPRALDALTWAIALAAVAWLGLDGASSWSGRPYPAMALAAGLSLLISAVLQRQGPRFATVDEIPLLLLTDVLVTGALMSTSVATHERIAPLPSSLVTGALALTGHMAARWLHVRTAQGLRTASPRRLSRIIVLGAGYDGARAIDLMLDDAKPFFQPVAVLDDDPAMRHRSIRDIRVRGPWSALPGIARATHADAILLADPSAASDRVDEIVHAARTLGLDVRVMPSPADVTGRTPSRRPEAWLNHSTRIFRPLEMADLLARRNLAVDAEAIAALLTGERVMVTGVGGAIGSQLCREIARYEPERLIMVDRDPAALHNVQLSLEGNAVLESPDLILGDLRTPGFIDALLEETRPTVVFHAAVLKNLALAERFPEEAFLTNVAATRDLLLAASAHDVRHFITISSSKAATSECVLGHSMRLAERLTSAIGCALDNDHCFISVRFGSVLDSRSSALRTFASQLERGLPMTITDPRMQRSFMTAEDICQLVLQAAVVGRSGEALVLDMGEPHNVEAIARRFARLLGHADAHVVYTGIRPGEKVVEPALGPGEVDDRPSHPLISQIPVPPLPMSDLGVIDDIYECVRQNPHCSDVHYWMESSTGAGRSRVLPAGGPHNLRPAA